MVQPTLHQQILALVTEYAELAHTEKPFIPGETPIPVSGKIYGANEIVNLVDSSLEFWLTSGRYNTQFENRFAEITGINHALTTNSGSSANFLAFSSLTSPDLEERALKPGDEIITVAACFPTTVNPILLHGMVPVFVDIQIPTYNIIPDQIESAISDKTRAIMLAHTLGNPFDINAVIEIAERYNLWVIEDCCDALTSKYGGQMVGTFGDIATCSFYPAHHITMGEGGMVFTNNSQLKRIVESMRDWGRDCYCEPGKDNTCGKRFGWQLGNLPYGYDHKYTYSQLGYNLKITDMQAAIALAQLDRLHEFTRARKENFNFLKQRLASLQEFIILPEATPDSEPSWFGFPITLRSESNVDRLNLLKYLSQHKIDTRLLFAGNITRQPYFRGRTFRVSGTLTNTDKVMNDTFWLGIYPGINTEMLDFVANKLELYFGIGF